jgi:endonuclease YncB( thermonuclease family)
VARVVLRNGAGRASADASAQYRQDEERARRAGQGVWRTQQ